MGSRRVSPVLRRSTVFYQFPRRQHWYGVEGSVRHFNCAFGVSSLPFCKIVCASVRPWPFSKNNPLTPENQKNSAMTHSSDKDYWDEIWQGGRATAMAAGEPNSPLVKEVVDLTPGTALEAGCGAGAEVIWRATRGWQVTAADIATDALARAAERPRVRKLLRRIRA